ncbi:glycosyltransferase family 4 protein [Lentisalinibacter sediminis]|uniref:glycosyltransferase family 4 protein n=1 Tax=Lentisalinibacter sediminis TaxID=2992237 RepID=UPI003866A865
MDSALKHLKIAHINLARGFRGGERQTELLIRALAKRKIRQKLIARRSQPLCERLRDIDSLDVAEVSTIFGACHESRLASLIHVHDGRSIQAAALSKTLFNTPYIVTRRVDNPIRSNFLTRRMYVRASALVALSNAIVEQIRRFDTRLQPEVIPSAWNPVEPDPRRTHGLRSSYGGAFTVGNVGALDQAHKGQMAIISAARALPDVLFVLVGSGRDETLFREAASGLENVRFAGQVDNVASYLASFDIFAFPSLHEGLGSILLDALRLGVPVVASDVGGIPDIITDDVNGMLIPAGDAESLTAAVERLAGHPELRQRYAEAGKAAAEAYSPDAMTSRYMDLYRRVLST